jgi:NAD(P)-dependent dehydrogenase (short-subunit alcohol dehydrogenase family)
MKLFQNILDRSVVASFDKTGFNRHARRFDEADLAADLTGVNALVTGANSGIGRATALGLMRRGAHVVMVSRSQRRAEKAAAALRIEAPQGQVSVRMADLSELGQVRELLEGGLPPISILIHNAGDMLKSLERTSDGHETITATHVLAPYLLTLGLQQRGMFCGSVCGSPRVVFVSSGGMLTQALEVDKLGEPSRPYDGMTHYALTKRAQVVMARMLDGELAHAGVRVFSMHPGWVDTPAVRRAMPKFHFATRAILRSPEQGADTILWLSMAPDAKLQGGAFYFDRQVAAVHRLKRTIRHSDPPEKLLDYMAAATGMSG